MIYLPAAPTIYTGACKRYTIPPAAGESKQAANKVERQVAGGCDGAKRRGCVRSMACRQPAATAWDQLLPVHGRVFLHRGLSYESGPAGFEELGMAWGWERWGPRAGSGGGEPIGGIHPSYGEGQGAGDHLVNG